MRNVIADIFISILMSMIFVQQSGAQAFREELSLGKFYEFSVAPSVSYPDRWGNEYTSGTILTDELRGVDWPLRDSWLAWSGTSEVEITLDLGKIYSIEEVNWGMCSRTGWGVYYPNRLSVLLSSDKSSWTDFGPQLSAPDNTISYSTNEFKTSDIKSGRYVKIKMLQDPGNISLMDEVQVLGQYCDSRKHVPEYGCIHGAYPISPDNPYMNIASFEALAKKSIRMVLWYADWKADFESSIGYLYDRVLGGRQLEVGFLPYDATAENISQGSYDNFLKQWFSDCAKRNQPLWIRPMNEFNGSWTFYNSSTGNLRYGGKPLEFRWAWRRMYNIAERVGCVGNNQIFVWSPNMPSYPGTKENHFAKYYPGNTYVDWVGASCYNNGNSSEVLLDEWYQTYSQRKPLMIAEGGSDEKYDMQPKSTWVTGLYSNLQIKYPGIKAMVWFHPQNLSTGEPGLRIDSSQNALSSYQKAVSPSYFLDFNAFVESWIKF